MIEQLMRNALYLATTVRFVFYVIFYKTDSSLLRADDDGNVDESHQNLQDVYDFVYKHACFDSFVLIMKFAAPSVPYPGLGHHLSFRNWKIFWPRISENFEMQMADRQTDAEEV